MELCGAACRDRREVHGEDQMSSTTINTTASGRVGLRAFPEIVTRLAQGVGRFFSLSRAERELEGLDDRLLADIGLRRSEIHRMVWGGRRIH